jgi:UTP--glucose-1-phosphate uridylyltransferase
LGVGILFGAQGKQDELRQIQQISEIANIHTVRQKEQKGLGHAIYCAKAFVGNEPFAVLLGDDVVDNTIYPAIKQLCDQYDKTKQAL